MPGEPSHIARTPFPLLAMSCEAKHRAPRSHGKAQEDGWQSSTTTWPSGHCQRTFPVYSWQSFPRGSAHRVGLPEAFLGLPIAAARSPPLRRRHFSDVVLQRFTRRLPGPSHVNNVPKLNFSGVYGKAQEAFWQGKPGRLGKDFTGRPSHGKIPLPVYLASFLGFPSGGGGGY